MHQRWMYRQPSLKMENYDTFPLVYDDLMDKSLYEKWVNFVVRHSTHNTSLLDLGCGTGEFALRLAERYDVSGLDLAANMLVLAQEKFTRANIEIPLFEANMLDFDLGKAFETITCLSDSLNYMPDEESVLNVFERVLAHLSDTGTFIFDVHSTHKVDVLFDNYVFADNDDDVSFIWRSFKGEHDHSVEHDLSFFLYDEEMDMYTRRDELHCERTYPIATYERLLAAAGFKSVKVCADFTDNAPTATSERLFFVCRK